MNAAQTIQPSFIAVRTLSVTLPGSSTIPYFRSETVSSVSPAGLNCTNSAGTTNVTCTAEFDVGGTIRLAASDPTYRFYGPTGWVFSGPGAGAFCGTAGAPYAPECSFTMPAGSGQLNLLVNFGQLGNLVFLTDGTYQSGASGSAGFNSLAAADTLCGTEATSAGLPGTYVAYLSNGATSFASRYSGTATGWVRPDGRPIASDSSQLFGGALIHPPSVTASGAVVPNAVFWSNTLDAGGIASSTNSCNNWAANTASYSSRWGHAGRTSRWANDLTEATHTCDTRQRLVCVQSGGVFQPVVPPTPPPGSAFVFLTTATHAPDVGLGGLDAYCASRRAQPGAAARGSRS